jgi:hypothetical protein
MRLFYASISALVVLVRKTSAQRANGSHVLSQFAGIK